MRHSPYISALVAASINAKIGVYPDYPKPGILFRDVTPLLGDEDAFAMTICAMCAPYQSNGTKALFNPGGLKPTHIAGIESRGFIFGSAMASLLGVGFVPVRKLGAKFPGRLDQESYELEYGTATLVCQAGSFKPGDRVVVVDDLIATGGSAGAATRLALRQGAEVIGHSFVIELAALKGATRFGPNVHSVLIFD